MVVIVEVVDKDVSLSGSSLLPTVEVDTVEGRAVDELAARDDVDEDKLVSLSGSSLMEVDTVDKDGSKVEAPVVEGYGVDDQSSVDVKDVSLSGS